NYKFILAATSILGGFSLSGMGQAVIQGVAQKKDGVLKDAINESLRWSIITVAIAGVIFIYYWLNDNQVLSWAILITGLATPIINSYGLYGGFLNGRREFKVGSSLAMISQVLGVIVLIITAMFFHNALYLVLANFAINTLVAIGFYFYVLRTYKPNPITDHSLVAYGKHVSLINFLGTIASQLDKILIFHYLGAIQLAIYAFATAIPEQIRGSYKNLFNLALPKYSAKEGELKSSIIDKTLRLTVMTVGVVLTYMVFAPFIYKFFFPKYLESISYSQWYILGLITIPGLTLFNTYFQVKKETKILYQINIVGNVSMIILSYWLVKNYGLWGAVIENGSAWLIMLLISAWFFFRHREN
ncbi:MAG: oligosaccharide flippase family protein, partial [Patescibacteria group bacterium]